MGIQSILFDKSRFTIPQAINWLDRHDREHYKVHTTANYHRFRQYDPKPGKRYITKEVDDGVYYVIDIN